MSTKRKKVFIFDDNKDILDLCILILEELDYEVKTSVSSNNISEQVADFMPDIILMDNWLPDVGGIAATQELKNNPELKHIPVIYFSANNEISKLAETAGADDYLSKPFDIQNLEAILEKY